MEKPFVVCAVITNDNREYLLIKRARDPYKDHWSLISGIGASMKGLSPEEAVRDEVMYDVGVDFQGDLCFDYPLHDVDYADKVYVFLGRIATEDIRLNPESVTEMKWFTSEQIESEGSLAFDDTWILEEIGSRLAD